RLEQKKEHQGVALPMLLPYCETTIQQSQTQQGKRQCNLFTKPHFRPRTIFITRNGRKQVSITALIQINPPVGSTGMGVMPAIPQRIYGLLAFTVPPVR
ncbi:MAG: hypothetical protein OXF79_20335, partial [Chloroflexi bacterium]|nr:hypothetical protein [Chloroflexota bacterium]